MPPIVGILIGLGLLALLGVAVAYASGLGARPATAADTTAAVDGDESTGIGPERKAQLAIGLSLALALITLLYGLNEPGRQAQAVETQRHLAMERGAQLYAQYCYSC